MYSACGVSRGSIFYTLSTYDQLQNLLRAALDVEEQRERATQKLEKKLQLAELTHQEREKVWLEEMTQGILDNEVNERGTSDNEEGEGEECILARRPVRADDRKTRKQRRKERERKKEVSTARICVHIKPLLAVTINFDNLAAYHKSIRGN